MLYLAVAMLLLGGAVFAFGPREPVDREIAFDAACLGDDLDAWLAEREARVKGLRPGDQKRILWAAEAGAKTPLAVVYVHGFSASPQDIRPVPEEVAAELGANLHFTRLSGHGRDGPAMAEPRAGDWVEDLAEALAIGRRLGDRVVLVATSTGGTLAALAASDPLLSDGLAGVVLISPNFRPVNPMAGLLTLPWARYWAPLLAGKTRSFEPLNAEHGRFWTTSYPLEATIPMMALVAHVARIDFARVTLPALFLYSEQDSVVSAARTRAVASAWGGPLREELRVMGPGDDPAAHVIAGDILSPGQTAETAEIIAGWAKGL